MRFDFFRRQRDGLLGKLHTGLTVCGTKIFPFAFGLLFDLVAIVTMGAGAFP